MDRKHIINCDFWEILNKNEVPEFNHIITDPPWMNIYNSPDLPKNWFTKLYNLMNDTGNLIIIIPPIFALTHLANTSPIDFVTFLRPMIHIQGKTNLGKNAICSIRYEKNPQPIIKGYIKGSVINYGCICCTRKHPFKHIHKTPMCLEILRRIILTYTKQNDIILDCFAGSGTTGYVALKNKRKFIGYEYDKETTEKANNFLNKKPISKDILELIKGNK